MDLFLSDLDGTLKPHGGDLSKDVYEFFKSLGQNGVTRAVATGRTLHGALDVIPSDFPLDYLVFSSGAGILDWKSHELLLSEILDLESVNKIAQTLISLDHDFMVHREIPHNHEYYVRRSGRENPDFERRIARLQSYNKGTWPPKSCELKWTQLVAIEPADQGLERYEEVRRHLAGFGIVLATSPLDNNSYWIEVFKSGVSKGRAAHWLRDFVGNVKRTIAFGDDYNDRELLASVDHAFIAPHAPEELRSNYQVTKGTARSGLDDIADAMNW